MGSHKKNRTFRSMLTGWTPNHQPDPAAIKIITPEGRVNMTQPEPTVCNGRTVYRITFKLARTSSIKLRTTLVDNSYTLMRLVGLPVVNGRYVTIVIDGDEITARRLGKHLLREIVMSFWVDETAGERAFQPQ